MWYDLQTAVNLYLNLSRKWTHLGGTNIVANVVLLPNSGKHLLSSCSISVSCIMQQTGRCRRKKRYIGEMATDYVAICEEIISGSVVLKSYPFDTDGYIYYPIKLPVAQKPVEIITGDCQCSG